MRVWKETVPTPHLFSSRISFYPWSMSCLALHVLFPLPFWPLKPPHLRNLPLTFVLRCPCPRLGNLSPPRHALRPPSPFVPLHSPSPQVFFFANNPLPSWRSCSPRPHHPGQPRSLPPTPAVLPPDTPTVLSSCATSSPYPTPDPLDVHHLPQLFPSPPAVGGERKRHFPSAGKSGGLRVQPRRGGGRAARGGAGSL